jgi:hypothetical protein
MAPSGGAALPYGELQHAATYLGMARTLRGIGIGNIIWGFLVIAIGVSNLTSGAGTAGFLLQFGAAVGIAYIVIGLAIVGEGVWFIAAPTGPSFLIAAITMFISCALMNGGPIIIVALIFYGISLIQRFSPQP